MRRHPFGFVPRFAAVLACLTLFAGCGGDDDSNPVVPQPNDTGMPDSVVQATTPANLLVRFDAAYSYMDEAEFMKLFTADYSFTFSSQSDPALVAQWGTNWGKDDESQSMGHLLHGYTDDNGVYQPPLTDVLLSLEGASVVADTTHADSSDYYKVAIVPRILLEIALSDGTVFIIDAPHNFHLVRGDAAVLSSDQVASADRWYIRRWDDRTPSIAFAFAPLPAENKTWGSLKAQYHR